MTSPLLDSYRFFPVSNSDELQRVLVQTYTDLANSSNFKEIAQYQLIETLTGQQFFNLLDPSQPRFTYRTCFTIGAIPTGTNIAFAHNISPLIGCTYIGGAVTTTAPDYRPLPYVGVAANDYISIRVGPVNVVINVGAGTTGVTSGILVLEYFKN